eukprot:TRINITY_DN3092_c1_g1_i15.p1 TRINITY_DN3092_c1_g1~~TRINITY_DN3092_c1_g1_i15.p1  ORF type:complete len:296 (+),score=30.18 TRINITY_DN3092_c1_g1_i15:554-1441(+)
MVGASAQYRHRRAEGFQCGCNRRAGRMMTDGAWEEKEASDPGKVQVPSGPMLLRLYRDNNQADDPLPDRMTIFEAVVWVATRDPHMVRAAVFSAGFLLDLAVQHGGAPSSNFGVETVAHSYLRPDVKGHYCVCDKADCTCVDDAAVQIGRAAGRGALSFGDAPADAWAGASLKWDNMDPSFACDAGDLLIAFPQREVASTAATQEVVVSADNILSAAPAEKLKRGRKPDKEGWQRFAAAFAAIVHIEGIDQDGSISEVYNKVANFLMNEGHDCLSEDTVRGAIAQAQKWMRGPTG